MAFTTYITNVVASVLLTTALVSMRSLCMQAFNLVDSKELVPLQELIDQMVS